MEYWYDPNHTGCLRIVDTKKQIIYGSDPTEKYWVVTYTHKNKSTLVVDFRNKKTHHGKKDLVTKYEDRNMTLHWEDGNKWRRIKNNPFLLMNTYLNK